MVVQFKNLGKFTIVLDTDSIAQIVECIVEEPNKPTNIRNSKKRHWAVFTGIGVVHVVNSVTASRLIEIFSETRGEGWNKEVIEHD